MNLLPRTFYLRKDVVKIARELIGKYLVTRVGGEITSGIISETEAYEGVTDRASHAYGNRLTPRTEVMYREGGTAYIYLCYGIHSLFNIVTNKQGIPHAVLIRSIIPAEGTDIMLARTGKNKLALNAGTGPGRVTKLLGLHYSFTGTDLCEVPADKRKSAIWLEDRGKIVEQDKILVTPRIGVDYAGADALLPYRFLIKQL